jgi:methanogenic corrinoid protein MtbC1
MTGMTDPDPQQAKHPIQVVARRTGLSQDVIRVWERRYSAVTPQRSPTNRRLYSDADIRRLRLLSRAIAGGRRIGDVAGLPTDELEAMVVVDTEAAATVAPRPRREATEPASAEHFEACLSAVEALDSEGLERELSRAAVELSTPLLLERLLVPLLQHIGEGWRSGTIRVTQEHMASAIVRSFLGSIAARQDMAGNAPEILITTPAGQMHELGALMAAVLAVLDGWHVTYLGPNLPAEEIVAAARQRRTRAVALSIVYAGDPVSMGEDLRKLRRLLDHRIPLIVGGSGAAACEDVLREIGAIRVDAIQEFRAALDRVRAEGD